MTDQMPTRPTHLRVVRARVHNLKGVSCNIPHGAVTVVTGPSGSGKSSLVFDTLFAEGQRRFVESMPTYAQQFLPQLERPVVDAVEHLLPAVALEAKNGVRNARSTVGTLTEIQDLLRLLFAHLGEVECPRGHGPVRSWTSEEVAAALAGGLVGDRILLAVPLPRPPRRPDEALAELLRQGYFRVLVGGEVLRLEPGQSWPPEWDPLELALGRFGAGAGEEGRRRLGAAVEEAFRLGPGRVVARGETETRIFAPELLCTLCGEGLSRPTAALFSFNSPLGACPTCSGFGRVIGIDRERVVPDPVLTLAERPFAPWNTPAYEEHYPPLFAACRRQGVPLDVPWRELPEAQRSWVWEGGEGFLGLEHFFAWLEGRTYRVHVRVLLARYRAYHSCPDCGGARLRPEALRVRLRERTLPELGSWSIEAFRGWLSRQHWREAELARGGHLLGSLQERLDTLHRVGLDYLTLDRTARTLSGGETQRIHLAAALGSGLTGTLYALDEPTVGLHPRDSRKLLELLRDLAGRGNTVVVVEHDPVLIRGADHIIELGPGAGEHGGTLQLEGSAEALLGGGTLTGRALRRSGANLARRHLARWRQEKGWRPLGAELEKRAQVEILGARAHNLRGFDVRFPLGVLVAVTGVSGSGKSTLVGNVLHDGWRDRQGEPGVEPGACRELRGLESLSDMLLVDQRPLGRSSRSNPVSYVQAYDELRKLFAATPEARSRGLGPGHFSFNLDRGRCPDCRGTGSQEVDLQFMGTVTVVCEGCQGRRFRARVLEARLGGRDIAETLELTVAQTLSSFAAHQGLCRKLRCLEAVGLGYLRLGQPTSTLSAGEAQRLKLAGFLRQPSGRGRRLLLFDEPTTGLHLTDIALLYRAMRRLLARGDGVVVVEHQLDLVARADWIVDLGPEGGTRGGELLYSGPLQGFLDGVESPTAEELRSHLGWRRRRRYYAAAG